MNWNEGDIRERIEHIILMEGVSKSKFASVVGINASNFNQIMQGKRGVPQNLPSKICEHFSEIRLDWLLYGDGEMYWEEQHAANGEALRNSIVEKTKPRLPVAAAAGGLSLYADGIMREQCEMLPIIRNFPDYDYTMYIKGNSMEPKYESGDEIAIKRSEIIEWGKDYVLDTADGAIFKKIYDAGDSIRCVSYNHEEYPDFLVPKSSIFGYYRFVGLIRV